MLLSLQIWGNQPAPIRIPAIVLGIVLIGLRFYLTYKQAKDVHRPPRVRRMERNIAIALWSFIALAILVLFLSGRFR
jgi:uncharacterized membrane protein